MCFTAPNRLSLGVAIGLFTIAAFASDKPPSVLKEPVLGLRYETARVRFEPLPPNAITECETLRDNKDRSTVWYVYARATDTTGRKYFIIGGYDIRHDAPPGLKYQTDGLGVVLFTHNGTCTYIDSARQVFEDRLFDQELPEATLIELADDFANRLVRAHGGEQNLRAALQRQHFNTEELPPELGQALQPYLTK